MNLEKADLFAIVQFGNYQLFTEKLKIIKNTLDNIKNEKDLQGISLLQRSIIGKNFDISKELLLLNCKINVISKEGYNELHYIYANLKTKESFSVAKKIIEKGGDLNLKDKLYGNTPFNYICQEAIKQHNQTEDFFDFVKFCMKYNPDLNSNNFYNINIIKLVKESKNEKLIQIILNNKN